MILRMDDGEEDRMQRSQRGGGGQVGGGGRQLLRICDFIGRQGLRLSESGAATLRKTEICHQSEILAGPPAYHNEGGRSPMERSKHTSTSSRPHREWASPLRHTGKHQEQNTFI